MIIDMINNLRVMEYKHELYRLCLKDKSSTLISEMLTESETRMKLYIRELALATGAVHVNEIKERGQA